MGIMGFEMWHGDNGCHFLNFIDFGIINTGFATSTQRAAIDLPP